VKTAVDRSNQRLAFITWLNDLWRVGMLSTDRAFGEPPEVVDVAAGGVEFECVGIGSDGRFQSEQLSVFVFRSYLFTGKSTTITPAPLQVDIATRRSQTPSIPDRQFIVDVGRVGLEFLKQARAVRAVVGR
jgi:hypothetical protein